ncbi:Rrf2 family transcriptional regulator [Candidatus Bipolaricaulota bacterium]|nr:Rrf2 family transcriptional regulator [Candidatus Bipolaricaulota bacterium]
MRLASGIRALYELALLPERRSAVRELAKACGVSEPFLRRIFLDLRAKGYLEAQKGRVGGFKLVKEPQDIKIADLAKILEKEPALVLGRVGRDLLSPDPSCPTYPFWESMEQKFMQEMDKLTLADVIALAGEAKRPAPAKKARAKTTRGTRKKKTSAKASKRSRRRSRR